MRTTYLHTHTHTHYTYIYIQHIYIYRPSWRSKKCQQTRVDETLSFLPAGATHCSILAAGILGRAAPTPRLATTAGRPRADDDAHLVLAVAVRRADRRRRRRRGRSAAAASALPLPRRRPRPLLHNPGSFLPSFSMHCTARVACIPFISCMSP